MRQPSGSLWLCKSIKPAIARTIVAPRSSLMFGDVHPGFSCFFHGNAVHLFKVIKKMVGAARIELATPPV
jgi:hypothetical protein